VPGWPGWPSGSSATSTAGTIESVANQGCKMKNRNLLLMIIYIRKENIKIS